MDVHFVYSLRGEAGMYVVSFANHDSGYPLFLQICSIKSPTQSQKISKSAIDESKEVDIQQSPNHAEMR